LDLLFISTNVILITGVGGGGAVDASSPPKLCFGENPGKIH